MENFLRQVQVLLATTVPRWSNLTQNVPAELLRRPPAPGEWSALECLQHLLDAEQRVFPVRIRAFLAGQDFPAFDPDSQGSKPDAAQQPAALAAEFARCRAESLDSVAKLTSADLPRRARHAELGMVTLEELLHEWVAHDLMHTVQAERAVMQPFLDGCGPWRPYFADHDVQARARQ